MKSISNFVLVAILLSALGTFAKEEYAPLPPKLLLAKTVFIENKTGHAEAGDALFKELNKWGRFQIAKTKSDAELVFVLTLESHESVYSSPSVTNQVGTSKITTGGVRSYTAGSVTLNILDAHNDSDVWENTKPLSRKGATHDLVDDLRKRIETQEKEKNNK